MNQMMLLDMGTSRPPTGSGAGVGLVVEASSDDGDTWIALGTRSAHDASNLTDGNGVLKLRITAPATINLTTLATTVPQVLAAPSLPVECPAGVPTVIELPNTDPGETTITLTFDDATTWDQEITCYTLDGVLRTVDSSATAPEEMTIAFAPISDADIAAAVAYTTPAAALAASGADDWIVITEDAEFVLAAEFNMGGSKAARLCSEDSVAPTWGRYGDGARLNQGAGATTLIRVSTAAAAVRVHDVGLFNPGANDHVWLVDGAGASLLLDRCRLKKDGTFEGGANVAGTCIVANSIIEVGANAKGAVCAAADESAWCYNCTIIAIDTVTGAQAGPWGSGAGQRVKCSGTYVGVGDGCTMSIGGYTNSTANGVGGNGSHDTSAPGTTAYHSLSAMNFIADWTPATLDARPISRAVLANYPCPDISAVAARDCDKTPRTDWFMGAKWLPPAA